MHVMYLRRTVTVLAVVLALSTLPAVATGEDEQRVTAPMRYDDAISKAIASIGSHTGLAIYCIKHGVNFTDVAERLEERIFQSVTDKDLLAVYRSAYGFGKHGWVYAKTPDRFVNTRSTGVSAENICAMSRHQLSNAQESRGDDLEKTEPVGLTSDAMRAYAMIASYVGFAEYCTAHNVDYTALANRIGAGLERDARNSRDRRVFTVARNRGETGWLYSPKADRFINILFSKRPVRKMCELGHQQLARMSQMK
jgi:hypothetical protein